MTIDILESLILMNSAFPGDEEVSKPVKADTEHAVLSKSSEEQLVVFAAVPVLG